MLLLGCEYGIQWARSRAPEPTRAGARHPIAFEAGLLAIGLALLPPLDALSDCSFAVHMVQHLLLIEIAAPLIVLGLPSPHLAGLLVIPWPFGQWLKQRMARAGACVRQVLALATCPVPGLALASITLWLWHLPAAYNLALEHDAVHAFEHLTLVLAFLLFWWPVLAPVGAPGTLRSNGGRVLYLLAGATSSALLGGLITFAPAALYPHYATILGPAFALADQQRAGAVMWLAGSLIYPLAAALALRDGD